MKKLLYLLIMVVAMASVSIVTGKTCYAKTCTKDYGYRQYTSSLTKKYNGNKYKLSFTTHYKLDKKTKKISLWKVEASNDEYCQSYYRFEISPQQISYPRRAANKKYVSARVKFLVKVYRLPAINNDEYMVKTFHYYVTSKINVKSWGKTKVKLDQTTK